MASRKIVVMLGASIDSKGGISSVVAVYKLSGLFHRWPIEYLATYRDGTGLYKLWVAISSLVKYLSLLIFRNVAVVHVHSASRASFWRKSVFILLARLTRHPVIFHIHSGAFIRFYEHECGSLAKKLIRFILDHVDRIIVLSTKRKYELALITKNPRIRLIPNPVIIELDRDRENLYHKRSNLLLFMGSLNQAKGIFDLLKAFASVVEKHPDARLICCGEGERDSVARCAKELRISDSIDLPGWVEGKAKERLLQEAAMFVLPSYFEGLPMSLLEAMSARMPIVATTVGGIPDVVYNGTEGFLVNPGDVSGLAAAIFQLLENAELRSKMGEAGRRKVETLYAADKIEMQLDVLYREFGVYPHKIS